MNGSTCTDKVNGYTCTCGSGSGSGRRLETSSYDVFSMLGSSEVMAKEDDAAYPLVASEVYTKPLSLDAMQGLSSIEKAKVGNFTIGVKGYGEISFDVDGYDTTDVRSLDLRDALSWSGKRGSRTNLGLYKDVVKPALGVALNKPATLTVYFDKDWSLSKIKSTVQRKIKGEFVSFDEVTKELKFRINHF